MGYQCEFYVKVENHRRERTLPGSVAVAKELLITPENIQQAATTNKLQNRPFTKGQSFKDAGKGMVPYSFRGPAPWRPAWCPSYKGIPFGFKGVHCPTVIEVQGGAFTSHSRRVDPFCGPIHETKAVSPMVENQGITGNFELHTSRGTSRLAQPPAIIEEVSGQIFGGHTKGHKKFGRITKNLERRRKSPPQATKHLIPWFVVDKL